MKENSYFEELNHGSSKGKTRGFDVAINAYIKTRDLKADSFWLDDYLRKDEEVDEFCQVLKDAGITEFVETDTASWVMETLERFEKNGFKILGCMKVHYFDYLKNKEKNGLLLKLQ